MKKLFFAHPYTSHHIHNVRTKACFKPVFGTSLLNGITTYLKTNVRL